MDTLLYLVLCFAYFLSRSSKGFTDDEREAFSALLRGGLTDAFRAHWGPARRGYTYWGHRFAARAKNAGWRIDYFLLSPALTGAALRGVAVGDERLAGSGAGEAGRISDHAPLTLVLDADKILGMEHAPAAATAAAAEKSAEKKDDDNSAE